MKNTVFVLGMCLFSYAGWAQSTCETRVDAHQKSSTMQRVQYCLTPEYDSASHNPGLVFSGVSSPRTGDSSQPVEQKPTARKGTFKPEQVGVAKVFVETPRFPQVTDDHRVSQQEIVAKKEAVQQGKQMAQDALAQSECTMPENQPEAVRRPVLRQMIDAMPLEEMRPTTKPVRKMKQTRTKSTKVAAATPAPTVETNQVPVAEKGEEIMEQTDSYAPAMPQEIPAGAFSYEPATGTYDEYIESTSQDIEPGAFSYVPAN